MSPFSTLNSNSVNQFVPSMPADLDVDDSDSDSSDSDKPAAKQPSPFSTLNTNNNGQAPQSPFSSLNTNNTGYYNNSPFSTLANPSQINPLGPFGNPGLLLRNPTGLTGNALAGFGTALPFGLSSSLATLPGVGSSLEQLSMLDNPVYQQVLNPQSAVPDTSRQQQVQLEKTMLFLLLAGEAFNQQKQS
jgi:hypothetical protein